MGENGKWQLVDWWTAGKQSETAVEPTMFSSDSCCKLSLNWLKLAAHAACSCNWLQKCLDGAQSATADVMAREAHSGIRGFIFLVTKKRIACIFNEKCQQQHMQAREGAVAGAAAIFNWFPLVIVKHGVYATRVELICNFVKRSRSTLWFHMCCKWKFSHFPSAQTWRQTTK